jgi:spermidine synthase
MKRSADEASDDERAGLLRRAQSFLARQIIESRSTEHNPVLEVVIVHGHCVLNARNVNYSFGTLHRVFEDAFEKLHLETKRLNDVLLLGCGAGSVVQIVRGKYSIDCSITAVEIDPVVIELARKHFMLDRVRGLEVVCSDARQFVETCTRAFDLVVVDLFVDERVPAQFLTREFLESARKRLRAGGWLVFNAIDDTPDTHRESEELEKNMSAVFPGFERLDLTGNRIYRASV